MKQSHWPIFFLSSIASVINMVMPFILVRLISPAEMGAYKVFFLYLGMVPYLLFSGGFVHGVYYWCSKENGGKEYYKQIYWLNLVSGLLLIICVSLAVYLLPHSFDRDIPVIAFILSSFFFNSNSFFPEVMTAKGHVIKGPLIEGTFEMIKVLTILIIAWRTQNTAFIFWGYTIFTAFKFLVYHTLLTSKGLVTFRPHFPTLKKIYSYSMPMSVMGLLSQFVEKFDLLILTTFLAKKDFAMYSMGCLMIPPLVLLDMAMHKVLIPKLSHSLGQKDYKKSLDLLHEGIRDNALLIIPSVFGLAYFAPELVHLLFTDQYVQAIPFLQIFAFSYLSYILPHDALFRASGKTRFLFKIYLYWTPINTLLIFATAYLGAPLQVLMVSVLIRFIPKFIGLYFTAREIQTSFWRIFPRRTLATFSITILVLIGVSHYLLRPRLNWGPSMSLMLIAPIGVIYLILNIRTIKKIPPFGRIFKL